MRKYMILIAGILLLAVNANAAFPVNEAGIAAYVRVGPSVDLNKTFGAYEEIVNANKLDIIGKVRVRNGILDYIEYSHPLVYVGADGWIVAYYPRSEPASMIMQWKNFPNMTVNSTTLEDAISTMTTSLGISYDSIKGNINYYDFEYPEADGLMMIVEEATNSPSGLNSFSLLMLENLTLYNASFSHHARCGWLQFDSTIISEICLGGGYGSHAYRYGFYSNDLFERLKYHTVELKSGGASTVLIYRGN